MSQSMTRAEFVFADGNFLWFRYPGTWTSFELWPRDIEVRRWDKERHGPSAPIAVLPVGVVCVYYEKPLSSL